MHLTGRLTAWTGAALLLSGLAGFWLAGAWREWHLFALGAGGLLLTFSLLLTRWNGNHPALRAAGAAGFYWRASLLAVLTLAGTVLLNAFSARNYQRVDCTQTGLYSLSSQSRAVLEETQIPVTMLAFIRDPQAVEALHRLMERYQAFNRQFDYRVIDPQRQASLGRDYSVETPTQAVLESSLGRHKIDILTPFQQWRPDNEQRITSAILRVGRAQPRKVYFLAGHGERDLQDGRDDGFRLAAEALRAEHYQVETLSLAQAGTVPEDAGVLVSAGPQIDFQGGEAELLNAFLRRGGSLMILVDPLTDFRMESFLAPYGVALGHDLLLDESASDPVLGPAAPLAVLDRQHPVTRPLSGGYLTFPRAQSVKQRPSALGYRTLGLSSTSSRSWSESQSADGSPVFDPQLDLPGPHLVAVAAAKSLSQDAVGRSLQSRLLLVGDSDFAANAHFDRHRSRDFLLSAVQWLAGDAQLLDIPPRRPVDRRLDLAPGGLRLLRWILLLLLPSLPLLAGLWTWRRRR